MTNPCGTLYRTSDGVEQATDVHMCYEQPQKYEANQDCKTCSLLSSVSWSMLSNAANKSSSVSIAR